VPEEPNATESVGGMRNDSTAKSHLNHKEHKKHKEMEEKHPRLSVFIRGWKTFL
jgi:hypothetical protein